MIPDEVQELLDWLAVELDVPPEDIKRIDIGLGHDPPLISVLVRPRIDRVLIEVKRV